MGKLGKLPLKPFFKWVGGKGKLLREYTNLGLIPSTASKIAVEPFCGSAAVSLFLQPQRALVNDLAAPVWMFWKSLTASPESLYLSLLKLKEKKDLLCINRSSLSVFYKSISDQYNHKLFNLNSNYSTSDLIDISTLFIFLNKHSFNGVYRVNSTGRYNVPLGKNPFNWIPNLKDMIKASEFLIPSSLDYKEFLSSLDLKDRSFIFIDPPYYHTYNMYDKSKFSDRDHYELKYYVDQLSSSNDVALCSINHPDIVQMYKGYNIHYINNKTSVSQFGSKKQNELLITSY